MGKTKLIAERMDDGGIRLRRDKGKITLAEAYEELERWNEYGQHWIFLRVVYDYRPVELYDDGDLWEIYSETGIVDGAEIQKAYDTGFDDGLRFARQEIKEGRVP